MRGGSTCTFALHMTTNSAIFQIKLAQFEGPFDLLLFFIERDELDIYNIPIAQITTDFLGYIKQMEALNVDLASEFILVASKLMRIKAKLLLPRKELDEQGNEIDPREELVNRLIEYKRYKAILDDMQKLELERGFMLPRGNVSAELKQIATTALVDVELQSVTLFNLLKAYDRIMDRYDRRSKIKPHKVVRYTYSLEGERTNWVSRVKGGKKIAFAEVIGKLENRIHAIFNFLAMLELIQMQKLKVTVGMGKNNFWIEEGAGESE